MRQWSLKTPSCVSSVLALRLANAALAGSLLVTAALTVNAPRAAGMKTTCGYIKSFRTNIAELVI